MSEIREVPVVPSRFVGASRAQRMAAILRAIDTLKAKGWRQFSLADIEEALIASGEDAMFRNPERDGPYGVRRLLGDHIGKHGLCLRGSNVDGRRYYQAREHEDPATQTAHPDIRAALKKVRSEIDWAIALIDGIHVEAAAIADAAGTGMPVKPPTKSQIGD